MEDCPVHGGMFSSTLDVYPVKANNNTQTLHLPIYTQVVTIKNISDIAKCPLKATGPQLSTDLFLTIEYELNSINFHFINYFFINEAHGC